MSRKTRMRIAIYSTLGVLVLLLFLHPYAWQTAFGPRIRGIPLSYRQDQYRQAVAKLDHRSWVAMRILALVGVKEKEPIRLAELDKDEDMLPVVLSLADDPDARVRVAVARSLAKHAEIPEACDAILRLTEDSSPHVRAYAIAGLAAIGSQFAPALPRLRARMGDDDPVCRVKAAFGVCQLGKQADNQAVTILQSALKTEDWIGNPSVCYEAAHRLCQLGRENLQFLRILADGLPADAKTRHLGVIVMLEAGPAAIPVFVELLQDACDETREAAASSLGAIRPLAIEAVPALVRVRDDENEYVRFEAATALWRIDPVQFPRPGWPPMKPRPK